MSRNIDQLSETDFEILKFMKDFESNSIEFLIYENSTAHLTIKWYEKFYEFCLKDKELWRELKLSKSKTSFVIKNLFHNINCNVFKSNCNHELNKIKNFLEEEIKEVDHCHFKGCLMQVHSKIEKDDGKILNVCERHERLLNLGN